MRRKFLMALALLAGMCSCADAAISEAVVERAWRRIAKADGFKQVSVNVEDSSPNAWVAFKSADDFTINVTRGLMKILNTEEEMAGVWGHEIGHVRLGHYNKSQVMNLAENGFSRRQETQSDEYGVKR